MLRQEIEAKIDLQIDLDRALGRVDTSAQNLSALTVHLACTQVADLAGAQTPDTGVANTHATTVGQLGAGLLAGDQDRLLAVA